MGDYYISTLNAQTAKNKGLNLTEINKIILVKKKLITFHLKTNILTATDVAAEIMLFLDDFFCGIFTINHTEMFMELDNNFQNIKTSN